MVQATRQELRPAQPGAPDYEALLATTGWAQVRASLAPTPGGGLNSASSTSPASAPSRPARSTPRSSPPSDPTPARGGGAPPGQHDRRGGTPDEELSPWSTSPRPPSAPTWTKGRCWSGSCTPATRSTRGTSWPCSAPRSSARRTRTVAHRHRQQRRHRSRHPSRRGRRAPAPTRCARRSRPPWPGRSARSPTTTCRTPSTCTPRSRMQERNRALPVERRLLPAALVVRAVGRTAAAMPLLNGFWVDGAFRPGEGVHVGVAVSLRGGGARGRELRGTRLSHPRGGQSRNRKPS